MEFYETDFIGLFSFDYTFFHENSAFDSGLDIGSLELGQISNKPSSPQPDFWSHNPSKPNSFFQEHDVQFTYSGGAQKGNYVSSAHVTRTGRMKDGKFTKTAIITLHDMGLNGFTNYATLFGSEEMEPVVNAFTVFHVDFPCMKSPKLVNSNSTNFDDKENASPTHVDNKAASVSGQWDPNLEYRKFKNAKNNKKRVISNINILKLFSIQALTNSPKQCYQQLWIFSA